MVEQRLDLMHFGPVMFRVASFSHSCRRRPILIVGKANAEGSVKANIVGFVNIEKEIAG